MSSSFSGNFNNLLPENYILPEDKEEFLIKLREYLNSITQVLNTKDSGLYDNVLTITGQQFFPLFTTASSSSINYRSVLRKVIDCGSLPNSTTKSVAHGLNFTANDTVTRIYGAATNPNTSWIPLPYSSSILANNIELNVDSSNVNIITGSNRTAYTRTFVVIEYITEI